MNRTTEKRLQEIRDALILQAERIAQALERGHGGDLVTITLQTQHRLEEQAELIAHLLKRERLNAI